MRLSRRQLLAGVAGCSTIGTAAAMPSALAATDLAVSVDIVDWRVSGRGQIDRLTIDVESREPESVQPAWLVWGFGRRTQAPWDQTAGPIVVPAEGSEQFVIEAPGTDCGTRLLPNQTGSVALHDMDSERRQMAEFVPDVDPARLTDTEDCDDG